MCGIAGIRIAPGQPPVDLDTLRAIIAMVRHRGPDGWGWYRDRHIGLAHARLSIIDPSGGAQPIHNEDETLWIVFNGEIFNYRELRAELEARGHRFCTRTDTEVVVHGYEEFGTLLWNRLNGQFALALWDAHKQQLVLARDPLGILPLFYARTAAGVVFGSEIKSLIASTMLAPQIDEVALGQVFATWAVPPPRTVFRGVHSVLPGTVLTFDAALHPTQRRYWSFDIPRASSGLSLHDAADELERRLKAAVAFRLRADVPVGAYLSGGLDSAVIGQLVRHEQHDTFETFAVRFADPEFDETEPQRRMAALLGTRHHEVVCDGLSIANTLLELVWHCESPLLRTAPAPLFQLSRLVRECGLKVVLTGEGADELLAGYDIFKEDKVRRFWARAPHSAWRPALLTRVHGHVRPDQRRSALWAEFFQRGLTEVDDPFYAQRIRWENTAWTLRFLAPEIREAYDPQELEAAIHDQLPADWRSLPPLTRAQLVETVTFMSPYLLASQGDRVAMAHGVEVRYPFLDPAVIEFCGRLPPRLKLTGLRDKATLRAVAARGLPAEIARRPKQPYRAPMTSAIFGADEPDYVRELLAPRALERFGWADPQSTARLLVKARANRGVMGGEREEMALVGVLTLQILGHWFFDQLAGRKTEACERLQCCRPEVCVDLRT